MAVTPKKGIYMTISNEATVEVARGVRLVRSGLDVILAALDATTATTSTPAGVAARLIQQPGGWANLLAALNAANGTLNYDAACTAAGAATARQFGGIKSAAKRRLGPEYPLVEHVDAEGRWWVSLRAESAAAVHTAVTDRARPDIFGIATDP